MLHENLSKFMELIKKREIINSKLINLDLSLSLIISFGIIINGLISINKYFIELNDINYCGVYCLMAKNYGELILNQNFDTYYLTKSLPSLITWLTISILKINKTPININYALEIFNGLWLILSTILWYKISKIILLNRLYFWLGYIGLFFSQIFINITPHAQESPDNAAFLLGFLSIFFILKKSYKSLLILIFIAGFVQPQLKIILIPIFLLDNVNKNETNSVEICLKWPFYVQKIIDKFTNMINHIRSKDRLHYYSFIFFFIFIFSAFSFSSYLIYPPYFGTTNISKNLLPVSIIIQSIFLGFSFYKIDFLNSFNFLLKRINYIDKIFLKRLVIIIFIFLSQRFITMILGRGEILSLNSTFMGRGLFAYTFFQQSIQNIGAAIVIHFTFYGSLIGICLINWGRICNSAKSYGHGFILGISIILLLSNGTESRHLVAFLPWLAVLFFSTKPIISLSTTSVYILIQLISSRIYAPYRGDYLNSNDPFLMIWGPWISSSHFWDYFLVGFFGIVLLLISKDKFLKKLFKRIYE